MTILDRISELLKNRHFLSVATADKGFGGFGQGDGRLFPLLVDTRAENDSRPLFLIVTAWLAGVAVLLVRLIAGWWYVRRLESLARAQAASRWQSACARMARLLRLKAVPHVVDVDRIDVPTVVGWLHPVILLPVAALANLTPAQVDAIVAHDLAHIRRHDYLVNLLQTLTETLLF